MEHTRDDNTNTPLPAIIPMDDAGEGPSAEVRAQRPTADDIALWKRKHKRIFAIEFDGWMAYMRQPTVMDLERAMFVADKKGAKKLDFSRNLVNNCKLYMDPGFRDDDERETALLTSMNEVAAIREAKVEKL